MTQLSIQDLEWFSKHFFVDIRKQYLFMIPQGENQELEPSFDISIPATQLGEIVDILKNSYIHDQLQQQFPGIREAWLNYMTVVSLTAHDHEGNT